MKMKMEMAPPYKLAYMRRVGPYGPENVKLMDKFKAWVESKGLFNHNTIILGIAWDNMASIEPDNCRYDVCLVIEEETIIYDGGIGIQLGDIRGGRYAVFQIQHTAEAVQKAWTEMFPQLEEKGYLIDEARPILERYAAEIVSNHQCEICVPVKQKKE